MPTHTLERPAAAPLNSQRGPRLSLGDEANLHELLTVDDVAAVLKVSKSWVYEHTRSRGLPKDERLAHVKIGKYIRFEPEAVRAFIEKRCRV